MEEHTVENYLQSQYDFRYNVVTRRVSFKAKTEAAYWILDDHDRWNRPIGLVSH